MHIDLGRFLSFLSSLICRNATDTDAILSSRIYWPYRNVVIAALTRSSFHHSTAIVHVRSALMRVGDVLAANPRTTLHIGTI